MSEAIANVSYPTEPTVAKGELPDLFTPPGGQRISSALEWPGCAKAWLDVVLDVEYGGMPPSPTQISFELHGQNPCNSWPGKPQLSSYTIHLSGGSRAISIEVKILCPQSDTPVPVIINGDACWWRSKEVAQAVLAAGYALVLFDRTQLAKDLPSGAPGRDERSGALYDVYPDHTFGALSAWAWGYHRCVDLIQTLSYIDAQHIAISGHSRGGKTTLLAGATDSRIALINDNASCAGGSACFRYVGHGGETIHITNYFSTWFGDGIRTYADRVESLPFDQHCLLAALAPRPLLLTYALDDRWSNPEGMVQCAWATKEAYRFLGQPDNLAFHLRPGGHSHDVPDWSVLLDFMAWKWQGKKPSAAYNQHPYAHLTPAFSWSAPEGIG
jgi:cephalosporin-C deacetylase-like acetyl esterase